MLELLKKKGRVGTFFNKDKEDEEMEDDDEENGED